MYNVPGNRNSAEIGLKPYTFYTFWIQAVTLAGVGNSSERVENRTKEGGAVKYFISFQFNCKLLLFSNRY